MTKIPYILEPQQSEHESQLTITSISTKSRLKSLFQWHKNDHTTVRPSTRNGPELAPQSSENTMRPQLSPRSLSDHAMGSKSARLHDSDGPRKHSSVKILTDPPPLTQAYRQASIHAALEAPVSFTEIVRSREDSLSAKELPSQDLLEDVVRVKCAHKKTDSGDDTCITKPKIFTLVHGPYLLQFPGDSEPNTLPEKILLLDKDCVAFACDAVPGRPWVLQVSKPNSVIQNSQEKTLRPSWSRLTLRQLEDKRPVNTMLMIFGDSEELYSWLFALRKEIEHLGGMECRPNTEHDDRTWRDNLTRRFDGSSKEVSGPRRSSSERLRVSRKRLVMENRVTHTTTTTRPYSQESFSSSNQTNTSLERLRDSLTSNSFPTNLARVSATDSASSISPTTDCFLSIGSLTEFTKNDLSLRVFSKASNVRSECSQSQPARTSLLERRKLSVNSLTLSQSEVSKPWKALPNLPPTISGSPNDDLCQMLSLPTMSSATAPEENTPMDPAKSTVNGSGKQRQDDVQALASKPSQIETATRPKYTLFPVKSTSDTKDEPLANPDSLIKTVSSPKSHSASRITSRTASRATSRVSNQEPKSFATHRKSRSRTVTLELRQHRKSALLGLGQFDMPLRSPAATDDMIMSNFGVKTQAVPSSPLPVSQVPGLADLTFGLDFLKAPYQQHERRPTIGNQRTPSTRSLSSLRSDASGFSKAPVGPPPVGPLPAVPQRNSQASRISQHSQHSNLSCYSSRRSTRNSKPNPIPQNSLSRSELHIAEHTSGETHKRSRTISSSLNVPESLEPAPPTYVSKGSFDQAQKRSRSRSRRRQTSLGQQS